MSHHKKAFFYLGLLLSASFHIASNAENCQETFSKIENRVPADIVRVDQPEIRELKTQSVDKTVFEAIKEKKANFSYVVDEEGRIFAVEGHLQFTKGKLQIAIMKDASGNQVLVPIKESGTIAYDSTKKKYSFSSNYSLDLTKEEHAKILADLKKKSPNLSIEHKQLKSDSYSQVLKCSDILAGHLAAKNFHLDRIIARNTVSLTLLGLKDADLRRKYKDDPTALAAAERKLFLVFGVDAVRRTGTTYAVGVVGKQLVEHQAGPVTDYVARLGTGFASNYVAKLATDELEPILKKLTTNENKNTAKEKKVALTPEVSRNIMWYNNGSMAALPFIAKPFDNAVLNTTPFNYYDACRQGKPLRFLIGPTMMRVYESGIYTIMGLPKYFLWGV